MKHLSIFIISLISIFCNSDARNETINIPSVEQIVINDFAVLTESYKDNTKTILKLQFLDKVLLSDNEIMNNKIYVSTLSGIKGWIDLQNISYISNNFSLLNDIEDIKIYVPSNMKFIMKKENVNDNDTTNLIYENKFYNKTYDIIVSKFRRDFYNQIKYDRENDIALGDNKEFIFAGKVLVYNNLKVYYKSGYRASEGYKYHDMIININYNTSIGITLIIKGNKNSENNDYIAKKILFSVRLK